MQNATVLHYYIKLASRIIVLLYVEVEVDINCKKKKTEISDPEIQIFLVKDLMCSLTRAPPFF